MADVRPPDAVTGAWHSPEARRRTPVPQSFQTRLTFAFMAVVALTLTLVAPILVLRLDAFLREQEQAQLATRAEAMAEVLVRSIGGQLGDQLPVVIIDADTGAASLRAEVRDLLVREHLLQFYTDEVAQADVLVKFGPARMETDGSLVPDPLNALALTAKSKAQPERGQAADPTIDPAVASAGRSNDTADWGLQVTLTNPYTSRATTLAAINGVLLLMASVAFVIAVVVASFLAHRFSVPITRLTDASRRMAEGDLTSRVPSDELTSGTLELRTLSVQFNQMADRLEESVDIIRSDRDRSRDFLADVSHELRTPIAAMRTFVELLQGPAGLDPAARAEFLDSSATQLDRLDWLAQNLLELSKLDSGLVLLDLRPDDLRGTIESAVEQQLASAERKGIGVEVALPERPLRIRHDSPRIGQVVTNLVGNALKFTGRGGRVRISARPEADGGARIEVVDTGVGIPEVELPKIFDRFYRGSAMNEARSTGSGLGLSIVKSIVDMHHGTIAVESRVGQGSRFVVTLPRDPREVTEVEPARRDPPEDEGAPAGTPARSLATAGVPSEPAPPTPAGAAAAEASDMKMDESSPSATPPVNDAPARLSTNPDPAEPPVPAS
jgi:signal transduction histidine kinase